MSGLLLAGELSAYQDFAIYFLALGMPIILISLAGITGVHFWNKRRKKKLIAGAEAINNFEEPVTSLPLPPLTATDKQHAIKRIRKQLSGIRAKNVALRHDYLYYQQKIASPINLPGKNIRYMENFEEKITGYEKQIVELQNKIDMLETIPPPLNNEAHYLRELLTEKDKEILDLRKSNGDNNLSHGENINVSANEAMLNEQRQEINRLKNLVDEQEHVNDLLYESRQQVNFLQNQLEQRIKAAKILEQRIALITEELSQSQFQFHEAGKKILRTEELLEAKDVEIGQMRLQIDAKENELLRLKDEIHGKNDQLLASEKSMNEIMHENELHKSAIANDRDIISSFNDQLAALNEENEHLQDQLRQNKEILHRFYKELKTSVGVEENEEHEHPVGVE